MKPRLKSESMFSALLRDHARATDGSQRAFAARIGINNTSFSRWTGGSGSVPTGEELTRISEEIGKPVEVLEKLAGITLDKACDLIVTKPEQDGSSEIEQSIKEGVVNLLQEGGESLPLPAYIIFLPGPEPTQ
jgi:transcriptional regulator with XRE-family HTH domain